MSDTYHLDRSRVRNVTPEQWVGVRVLFEDKWAGMRVTPEEVALAAHISKGAGLAILAVLHAARAIDLRLTIYHACRAKPVSQNEWDFGFPTYPWVCPACQEQYKGPPHAVVEDLRYGIVGRLRRKISI